MSQEFCHRLLQVMAWGNSRVHVTCWSAVTASFFCISGLVAVHEETFQWIRDLPWHGRAIWKLAGTRVAWLNPLLLAMLTCLILGVSSARFAIIVCTPPAPWLLNSASFSDVVFKGWWLKPRCIFSLFQLVDVFCLSSFPRSIGAPNKALLDFQPANGQLVPQFRKGRRHYGWYRDLTLKQEMEVFSYSKSLGFGFSDLMGRATNRAQWAWR